MFEKECRKLNIYYLGLKNGKFIYYTFEIWELEILKILLVYYKLIIPNKEYFVKNRLKF